MAYGVEPELRVSVYLDWLAEFYGEVNLVAYGVALLVAFDGW